MGAGLVLGLGLWEPVWHWGGSGAWGHERRPGARVSRELGFAGVHPGPGFTGVSRESGTMGTGWYWDGLGAWGVRSYLRLVCAWF